MSEMTGWGECLNGKEAAEYLDIALQSLYELTEEWGIPYMRAAGRKLFIKSQLDEWRKENPTRGLDNPRSPARLRGLRK